MKKYIPLTICILAVAFLLAFAAGQGRAQDGSLADEAPLPEEVDANVAPYIPVQGRLTDASGNPLNGNYSIVFRLYDVLTGGTAICEDTNSVAVADGLFNSEIGNCWTDDITGQQLYLGIQVGSDGEMSPRKPIYPVPYAWSLIPGADIIGTVINGPILHLENWSGDGRGLRSYAMATTGENYGVVGASRSSQGYGGYFYNNSGGDGLMGSSASTTSGVGVSGLSEVGSGVYGKSTSGFGIYGLSSTSYGVYADTQNASRNYGFYTADNLYSFNYHTTGATMQVVQNGGTEPLEAGDVAVFSGMVAPTDANEPPVILVSKATTANSTAVAGVVYSRYSLEGAALEGPAQPGETLLLVVQGPARVKVSAVAGAIQPGELLSSSAQAGFATRVAKITMEGTQIARPGTVFAKALESLESGEGWIYVFVTLQ